MAKATEKMESAENTETPVSPASSISELENAAPEHPADPVTYPVAAPAFDTTTLHSLDTLASRHRVPGWQAAAVARSMGWEGGKQVTDGEYQNALASLNTRRMGGQ